MLASTYIYGEKASLPVDVRRSKRLYLSSLVHWLARLRNRWVLALFYVSLLYLLYSSVFTVIQSIYR